MKIFKAILVLLFLAAALPAGAVQSDGLSVEVVSDNSGYLPAYYFKDIMLKGTHTSKYYVEARRGENYGILISNRTGCRIGVVVAVDGRNIISGAASHLSRREAMYILDPYSSVTLDGWRTGSETVHRFYFTEPSDSYSVRTFGDDSAMGLIAVAAYREKVAPVYGFSKKGLGGRMEGAPAAPSASREKAGSMAEDRAGTGFGDSKYSPVRTVEFEPEHIAASKIMLKYEWPETLCRIGVTPCRKRPGTRLWDEFGYAPYPPDGRVR